MLVWHITHGIILQTSLKNNSCYLLFEQPSSGHFHTTPCISSYFCSLFTTSSSLKPTLKSVSPLLLLWQHLSKTCLHLYLCCCCFWMFHSQTLRPFLYHPVCVHQEDCRLSLTSHLAHQDVLAGDHWLPLTSQLTSQDVLAGAPLAFTLKSVTTQDMLESDCWLSLISQLTSQDVLASAPLTFTLKSVTSQDVLASAPLTFSHKSLLTSPIQEARHCVTVLFSWCSHLALVKLILLLRTKSSVRRMPTVGLVSLVVHYLLRYCNMSSGTGSHFTLSYLICGATSCLNELVLATRCHLNKINRVLFPLTVLRSLSFLIPSFTKINMLSYPVVSLPLTYAWGLLEACHRDSSLAVLFPLWLERLEALLEVVPSPYKSSSGFTTWVGSGLLSVLQADW